ncbi:hypothetical protein J3R30DRAFT_3679101 [Lentinula aciculospora]|uniref:CUE domain-containing protein n=1 Tax=Lentinula aciculospora TaxID=153920 RepID=A0A9W9AWH6_9AGAR|nr:hypothetical protein J3R30DRAFT_3681209 [Lentinula aciculospora]KAJ4490861.1 hypothetical protein J3R30DRAFT_3679101 [Lentinula aciculospora]
MTETTSSISSPPRTEHGSGHSTISLDPAPASELVAHSTETLQTESPVVTTQPSREERERARVRDPKLSTLQGMFPDFDESLLQSVLESVGGNSDRAIDVLLGMSDPEYYSESRTTEEPVLSQEELDARFARQLYMEDQEQQAAWQARQQQQRPRPTFSGRRDSQPPVQEKDTMTEISDQFNKIAETGKKTFGNIFSKVKAKISEFDQSRQEGSSWSTGVGGDTYPYEPGQAPYPNPTPPQQSRHQRMQQMQQQQLLRQQQQQQEQQARQYQQQPAYYDPNPMSESPPSSVDVDSTYTAATTPRTPPTSSGIDAGKLGLLPKRPVSLLRAPTTPPAGGAPGQPMRKSTELATVPAPALAISRLDSDAEELYADADEDPFEDEHEVGRQHGIAGHEAVSGTPAAAAASK